jgi:hypothetical protein
MTKWLVYSYNNKVTALEMTEEEAAEFVESNETELDRDTEGNAAWSIYNKRQNDAETAMMNFTNTYMKIHEIVDDEETGEEE